jgi:dipeptidyl aminopeptidase/acylaminoacyl peptidase
VPALALALPAFADTSTVPPSRLPVAQVLQALHKQVKLHDVAISPDGTHVAWVEQVVTPDGPATDRSLIEVVDRTHPERPPQHVTAKTGAPHDEGDVAFSPDGQRLAFLSDAETKGQPELYVAELGSGKVTQLTHVVGHVAQPKFSPDGKTVAVLFLEGAADALGPLGPATRQTGDVDENVKEQRLVLVPADGGGGIRAISPASLFVYEYAWRPDGKAFAAVAAPGSGDDNWWIAKLHVFDVVGGADRVVHEPTVQVCEPTYSPDGTRIAFIEGLMSDAGANGGDVHVVSATGGAAKNVTPGLRGSASSLYWLKDDEILFGMQVEGDAAFAAVPAAGGKVSVRWRAAEDVHVGYAVGAAFSRDGSVMAAVSEAFGRPPEIVAGPVGGWRPLTRRNEGMTSPAGPAVSVAWKSDRFDVQGWLVSPPQRPASGKAPMVVIVHGGPASAARSRWDETAMLLASQGYFVFLPNPRGSFGQGELFTRGNVKDFGYGDLRDILAGVDAVVARAPVDRDRVGIYGHSYGGYMAMWAVTQTRRFRASVASAGIANWQSYYGQNRIDKWMLPYFGKNVYEDPAVYARSSPITFITKVKTPTLVLHGERDAECPLPQGQEFWHALKTLGVDTQLVIYPDEGHRFLNPAHDRDHAERMVGWFDRYLGPAPRATAR